MSRKNKPRWKDLTTYEHLLKVLRRNGASEWYLKHMEGKLAEQNVKAKNSAIEGKGKYKTGAEK